MLGLLSPELAAGIRRVKGVKKLGVRLGNWLSSEEAASGWRAWPAIRTFASRQNCFNPSRTRKSQHPTMNANLKKVLLQSRKRIAWAHCYCSSRGYQGLSGESRLRHPAA